MRDALGLPAVVEPVVAVPAAAAACSHLHQPRPHVTRRPSNRHAVRQRVDGLWNPLVSGQRACAFVCGGADRPPEPPGAERTDRISFRAPANRPQQQPGDKRSHRLDHAPVPCELALREWRQRTRCVLQDQPVLTRAAGRCHAYAHEQLLVAGIVECVERLCCSESSWLLVDPMQLRR